MRHNALSLTKLPVARRGAKLGWPTVSGQLPRDIATRFDSLAAADRIPRSELVRLAITEYVERHTPAASLPLAA